MISSTLTIFLNNQSNFCTSHSTEKVLVKVLNDLRSNMDMKKLCVLVLLDHTAAFETVDHSVLLDRLHNLVGLSTLNLILLTENFMEQWMNAH